MLRYARFAGSAATQRRYCRLLGALQSRYFGPRTVFDDALSYRPLGPGETSGGCLGLGGGPISLMRQAPSCVAYRGHSAIAGDMPRGYGAKWLELLGVNSGPGHLD